MKDHIVKFFQFLKAKEGKNAPLKLKLLNLDSSKITKDDLNVKGELDLSETSITSLPEGLRVSGYLSLSGCTSLKSLPDGLYVSEYLDLYGCTSLKSLPNDLHVGDDLHLENTPLAEMYSVDEIIDMIEAKGGYVNGRIEI